MSNSDNNVAADNVPATPEAPKPIAPADDVVTIKASELTALKDSLEQWKAWSRAHETEAENLKRDMLVGSLLSEYSLPETAKEFLTDKKPDDLKAKAATLASMFSAVKPADPAPVAPAVAPDATPVAPVVAPEPPKQFQPNPLQGVTSQPVSSDFERIAAEVGKLFN